jgi:hypothetical protein
MEFLDTGEFGKRTAQMGFSCGFLPPNVDSLDSIGLAGAGFITKEQHLGLPQSLPFRTNNLLAIPAALVYNLPSK